MNTLTTLLLSLAAISTAAYDKSSSSNVAVYWGQNSINQATGSLAQKPLGEYCDSPSVDIFIISFVLSLLDPKKSGLNLANYMTPTNCKLDSAGQIISCDKLGEDIQKCQQKGKNVFLSVGGAQGITETWFASEEAAKSAATSLWKRYGPPPSDQSVLRPFGKASVDGIDLDIERTNTHMDAFAAQLRTEMGTDGKFLTAAMECDLEASTFYTKDLLNNASLDMVFVMAYNSDVCNAASGKWNAPQWFEWANSTSQNKDVKIFVGVPGGSTATIKPGNGYVKPGELGKVVADYKDDKHLGGVMIWDISQAEANSKFQDAAKSALAGGSAGTAAASAASSAPSATG